MSGWVRWGKQDGGVHLAHEMIFTSFFFFFFFSSLTQDTLGMYR